jgi:pantetheine-phosphate adenylyltransferase
MTHANRVLDKRIDSVFFMTDNKYSFLSSTTIKEIAQFDGDLSTFAPPKIAKALRDKFNH